MTATVFGLANMLSLTGGVLTGNLALPSVQVTGQLNANASFETGILPWTLGAGASLSQSSTYAYKGTYSMRLVPDGVSSIVYAGSELIACVASTAYTVTGWALCPTGYSAAGSGFSFSVNWYDSGQNLLSTSSSNISLPAGSTWTPQDPAYVSPSNAAYLQIVPALGGTPPATAITYLDEVRVAETSTLLVQSLVTSALQVTGGGVAGDVLTADAYGNATWQAPNAPTVYNVRSAVYGATGNGTTDDTAAIQAAINACAAGGGGIVFLPPGTYAVTPQSSTVGALALHNGTSGYSGVRLVGAGAAASTLRKLAAGPLIDMAGPASDITGATHCTYCSLEALHLSGNGLTGALVRTYYADNLLFACCEFANNLDIMHDSAEFWDSRFYDCVWLSGGSTTANASTPNVLLRNSAAASGFGYSSAGVTNEIYFHGCRWESFHTGALWLAQGVSSSAQVTSVYVAECKMESIVANGGPHFLVDSTCMDVRVNQLYCYAGGWNTGYSTANDVIQFSPYFGTLANVYINNASASAIVANGVTVNAPHAGHTIALENVVGTYTTAPTGAHLNFGGTNTGAYKITGSYSNNGTQFGGTLPSQYAANAPLLLSSGAPSDASYATTPLDGTLGVDTLNHRLYVRQNSGVWARIPLNTIASSVTATTTIANSAALSTLQSASVPANEPQSGTVYVINGSGTYSVTGTPTLTFAVYWGGTGGTLLVSIPAITAPSGITGAPFSYEIRLTFRSTTSVTAEIKLDLDTSAATDAASRYVAVTSAPVTVTTSGTSSLAVGFTWSAASSSNTISLLGGLASKVN